MRVGVTAVSRSKLTGGFRTRFNIALGLSRLGYDVTLLLKDKKDWNRGWNGLEGRDRIKYQVRNINTKDYDVLIIGENRDGILQNSEAKLKFIYVQHLQMGLDFVEDDLRYQNAVLCANSLHAKIEIENLIGRKCIHIPKAIDLSFFSPSANNKRDIILVARKGYEVGIRAVRKVTDRYRIVPYESSSQIDLINKLHRARLLVVPETGEQWSFCNPVAEGFATKVPTVCVSHGSVRELAYDNLTSFVARDLDSLSSKIEEALKYEKKSERVAEFAYKYIQQYDIMNIAMIWEQLILSILSDNPLYQVERVSIPKSIKPTTPKSTLPSSIQIKSEPVKVVYYERGGRSNASSRRRVYMIADELKERGFKIEINKRWEQADIVVFKKTDSVSDHEIRYWRGTFPKKPLIWDFCDAEWLEGRDNLIRHYLPNFKYITCSSNFLARKIRERYNREAIVIEDAIEIPPSLHRPRQREECKTGWVGNRGNLKFLDVMDIKPDIVVTDIKPSFNCESYMWKLDSWQTDLANANIGLAPLPIDEWCMSKSNNKIITYWSLGMVPIGSPIPAYKEIIEDGVNGFIAEKKEDWSRLVNMLKKDLKLRGEIVSNVSPERWYPKSISIEWMKFFIRILKK